MDRKLNEYKSSELINELHNRKIDYDLSNYTNGQLVEELYKRHKEDNMNADIYGISNDKGTMYIVRINTVEELIGYKSKGGCAGLDGELPEIKKHLPKINGNFDLDLIAQKIVNVVETYADSNTNISYVKDILEIIAQ